MSKMKPSNFRRFGQLIPNPIPMCPYDSISMDFIVNLPWSDDYNVVLVVVDTGLPNTPNLYPP